MTIVNYLLVGLVCVFVATQLFGLLRFCLRKRIPSNALQDIPGLPADCPSRLMLYFYAQNCSHCRNMSPVIDLLCKECEGIIKINTLQHHEIARRFNVRSLPTILLFNDGTLSKKLFGFQTTDRLRDLMGTG